MHKDYGQRLGLSSTQHLMNLHNNKAGRLVSLSIIHCLDELECDTIFFLRECLSFAN